MRISASCAGAAIVLLSAAPSFATKVTAKINISKEYTAAMDKAESSQAQGNKDCYWKLPNSILPVKPPSVDFGFDAVAVLFKDGESSKPNEVETVKVHAGQLERKVIVTKPGSTIKFLNVSPFNQELYSPDLSTLKPEIQSTNSLRAIEFPAEGIFEIKSKLYPHFSAYVVVTPGTPVNLKSDRTMTEDLEPGKYTLKVFHNGAWVHKQSFSVEGGRMDPFAVTLTPSGAEAAQEAAPSNADAKATTAGDKSDSKVQAETPKPEKNGN